MNDLTLLNPWWKGKEHLREDKHIREFEEKHYRWNPHLELELVPSNIFTLRGPRQVGKTTLIKLWIRKLLSDHPEKSVFFWNCDELVDFRELAAILREYLEFAKIHRCQEKYIFLDEISRVKDWQRAVKSMVDSGELAECCVVLTGSHTLDLKYGLERLPGRTGKKGRDLFLLPMSFSEYVEVIRPDLAPKMPLLQSLSISEINEKVSAAQMYAAELKILFSQYCITGGFPLVVNEFFSGQKIPDYIYELYARWVLGDLVKWGRQEKIAIQLLRSVIEKQASALSWDSLAKQSEIKSHKTVSAYVEDLENMFVLLILYQMDLPARTPDFSKNKKIYFLDPFIHHVFNKKIYFKENEIAPGLIEGIVISHLARVNYGRKYPPLYYWKNAREVDALLPLGKELLPLEVKYQNTIAKEDYKGLHHFNQGILLTKDFLKTDLKYPAVPVHLLLAMIGKKKE